MNKRKFLSRASLIAAAAAIPVAAYSINRSENYQPKLTSYTRNPLLTTVPGAEDYRGTPLDQRGLFMNEEKTFWPRMGDFLKWKTSANPYRGEKKNDSRRLEVICHNSIDEFPDNSITWLGHASFLFQLNGIRILLDPIFFRSWNVSEKIF